MKRFYIVSVDREAYTCTVATADGRRFSGVALPGTGSSGPGTGSYHIPAPGSLYWGSFPERSSVPVLQSPASVPTQDSDDPAEDPNNYRRGRPVLNEGDQMLASHQDAFVLLRSGGVLELGANLTTRRIFTPVQNTLHDIAENYLLSIPAGASFQARTRTVDAASGRTAVSVSLSSREYGDDAEDAVRLDLGRIEDEEPFYVPPSGERGATVFRLDLRRRFRLLIDRAGNSSSTQFGDRLETVEGSHVEYARGSRITRVAGAWTRLVGSVSETIQGALSQVVSSSRSVSTQDDSLTVSGTLSRIHKGLKRVSQIGDSLLHQAGNVSRETAGHQSESFTGSRKTVIGQSDATAVGTTSETVIANADGAPVALKLHAVRGQIEISDSLGTVRLTAGLNTVVELLPTGEVHIRTGTVSITQNNSGCRIQTPGGEVSVDAAGSVHLGPGSAASRGAVVTTLSHPFDYITGLPILGSSSVAAGGTPAPSPLPSTFQPLP